MGTTPLRRGQNDAEHINQVIGGASVEFTIGSETPVDIALDSGDASWTDSGTTPGEYYYDTAIASAHGVKADGVALVLGTLGALAVGEYAVGDQDTIGADTIYVRLTGDADPDTAPTAMSYSVTESINLAGQVKDKNGDNVAESQFITLILSDNATGLDLTAAAPDGSIAIGTDGAILATFSDKMLHIQTEADGSFDMDITESGAATWYAMCYIGNQASLSGAITFAA